MVFSTMAFEASALEGKGLLGRFRDKTLCFRLCHSQSSIYCEEETFHFRVPLLLPSHLLGGSPAHWQTFLSSCFGQFLERRGLQVFPKLSGGGCCSSKSVNKNSVPKASNDPRLNPEDIQLEPQFALTNLEAIPNFTGRESELEQIKAILKTENIVKIGGIEGSGKTALATTLALSLASDFEIVWKCTADTEANFSASLKLLGKRLSLRDNSSDLDYYLKSHKVLLLLDDFAFVKPELFKRLLELKVSIIITVREGWTQDIDTNINGLDPEAAVDFVIELTKRESERQDIKALCQELSYITLPLKNVTALLNFDPRERVEQVVRRIRGSPADPANPGQTSKSKLVLEECVKKVTSESGKRLLLLTLDLSSEVIPEPLYKEMFAGEAGDLEQAKKDAQALSLIEEDEQQNLSVHPLVQEAIRNCYSDQVQGLLSAKVHALFHLFDCTEISELSVNLSKSTACLLLAVRNERIQGNLGNPPSKLSDPESEFLILSIRSLYFRIEKLETAISDIDCAECQIWSDTIPAVTAETVSDLEYFALCCKAVQNYKAAEQYLSEVIDFRERGDNQEKLADSFGNLGSVYDSHFKAKDSALEYYQKALKIKEAILPTHPSLGPLYEKCANIYLSQRKWIEAEEFFLKSVQNKEGYLPPTHPDFDEPYQSLLKVYQQQEDKGKYEQLLLKILKDREEALPPTHQEIGSVCLLLAQFYEQYRKRSKAKLFYKRAQMAGAIVEKPN